MTTKPKCKVCSRDPATTNTTFKECSHIDCPYRRRAWSERPEPTYRGPWPTNVDEDPKPLDQQS